MTPFQYLSHLSALQGLALIIFIFVILFGVLEIITNGVEKEIQDDWLYGKDNNYKYNADEDGK